MKHLSILLISALVAVAFSSCVNNEEKMRKQYIEACADGNFTEARKVLDKMESETGSRYQLNEHLKYVNDKEIYSLLANLSRDNANRILYLYNTYEYNQLPNMGDVLEVAISQGDEFLPVKLIKAGVQPSKRAAEAAVGAESNDVLEAIIAKRPGYVIIEEVGTYYKQEFGAEQYKSVLATLATDKAPGVDRSKVALVAVNNGYSDIADNMLADDPTIANGITALEDYLAANPDLTRRVGDNLRKTLSAIKRDAPSFHSQGIVGFHEGRIYKEGDKYPTIEARMPKENAAIANYNRRLLEVYEDAVNKGFKDVARDAANAMKPTIEAYSGQADGENIRGFKVDGNHYLIYHNYDEINRLKEQLK